MHKKSWLTVVLVIVALTLAVSLAPLITTLTREYPETVVKSCVYEPTLPKICIGDIYLPPRKISSELPAVVIAHGGAWTTGSKDAAEVSGLVHRLVADGFAVFNINYRLGRDGQFPKNLSDVQHATNYLFANAARYQINPRKIAIIGVSAGAHLALLTAYKQQNSNRKMQAVVAIAPATDLTKWSHPFVDGAFSTEDLAAASPATYVKTAIPTLLVHGTNDCIVPYSQSELLYSALRATKIRAEIYPIQSANHDFILHDNQARNEAFLQIVQFLRRELNAW